MTAQTKTTVYDNPARLAYMTWIIVIAAAVFLLGPYMSEALGTSFGWDEQQRGLIATVELIAMAMMAFSAMFWIKSVPWKPVVFIALIVLILGNLLSGQMENLYQLAALRIVTGLAAGALSSIYMTFLSYTKQVDRNASIFVFSQVLFMTISFFLIPPILGKWGITGLFVFIAALYVPALVFFRLLPSGAPQKGKLKASLEGEEHETTKEELSLRTLGPGLMVLLASVFFFITQVGVWYFYFDLAAQNNLSEAQIINALVISTGLSLLGPAFSFWLRDRVGRVLPLVVPAIIQIFLMFVFAKGGLSFLSFLLCAALFQICWNFMLTYATAVLIDVDSTHRLPPMLSTAQALGIGVGPLLVGSFMVKQGVIAIAIIGTLALVAYMACIVPFARRRQSP